MVVGTRAFGAFGLFLESAAVEWAFKYTSRRKASGSVRLSNLVRKASTRVHATYAMIPGFWAKGLAFVGNIRIDRMRMGRAKRSAAKLDGPAGSRVHQCSNIVVLESHLAAVTPKSVPSLLSASGRATLGYESVNN